MVKKKPVKKRKLPVQPVNASGGPTWTVNMQPEELKTWGRSEYVRFNEETKQREFSDKGPPATPIDWDSNTAIAGSAEAQTIRLGDPPLHETYMGLVRREFDAARDLVLSKGNDYDWSIFEPPVVNTRLSPLDGIDARMSDKIKRLCALISGTKEAKVKESIEDTLRDLSAYCILRVIAMELNEEI